MWIPLAIIVLLLLMVVVIYNGLVTLRNRADEAWSDIDVQLKRRYDLIPNLVEAVKGYASHERGVFEEVTKARSAAMQAEASGDPKKVGEAENMLSDTLKSLFAVSENYPDLKASNNFMELQRELRDTEDKIQASRRFYNSNVRDLNIKTQAFPSSVIAGIFGFKKREFFEIGDAKEREVVKVNF
ncbi:MAG: LemA family protein [Candidatus Nealsonbacteria bacterium]|nr:LemA family protein [Candidatus Nealsonbacteria bacterium]